MATINSVTLSAGSGGTAGVYSPGETITATVDFTPDTPSTVSNPFTLTAQVTDASGNPVGSPLTQSFSVNTTQQGDKCAVSDSASRAWTAGAEAPQADGSIQQPFTATA